MGMFARLRALVDPWGARAAWLNEKLPGLDINRDRAKAITLSARAFSEGRGGAVPRDRWGRPIGAIGPGPRTMLSQDGAVLRREGELLGRFNPHARHTVRQIVNSVLMDGANIKPTTTAKSKKAQLVLSTAFARSFEETTELDNRRRMNFHGLSRFWLKMKLERGGTIIRIRPRKRTDPLAVPISLQTLSYDYLYDGPAPGVGTGPLDLREGETFANGIVFDALNEDIAYYLYRTHPDDAPAGHGLSNVTRVEKYARDGTQQIIHWFEPYHEDDHIGTPRGGIVYPTLTRKMDYDLSILDRKRSESKRNHIWEVDHGADPDDQPGRNTAGEWVDEHGQIHTGRPPVAPGSDPLTWHEAQEWVNTRGAPAIDNGEVIVSPPGYKYVPHQVTNFQDHPAFSEGLLREVAVGFYAPEWLATGDLRKLSFAGGELGLLYWQEDCKAEFNDFVTTVFRPIWRAWVAAGARSGMWAIGDIGVNVRQNRQPKRDLIKDLKYVVGAMNAGLMTRETGIMELGKDTIEEVNEGILREVAWARENGIPLEPGLYAVTASGSAGVQSMADAVADAVREGAVQQDPDPNAA